MIINVRLSRHSGIPQGGDFSASWRTRNDMSNMDENLGNNNLEQMPAGDRSRRWAFVFLVAIVIIFAMLVVLIIWGGTATTPGTSLPTASPQALTEGEKLAILNQLNSGGGSLAERQDAVYKLSASAPTITPEEKQKILNNLVGQK